MVYTTWVIVLGYCTYCTYPFGNIVLLLSISIISNFYFLLYYIWTEILYLLLQDLSVDNDLLHITYAPKFSLCSENTTELIQCHSKLG